MYPRQRRSSRIVLPEPQHAQVGHEPAFVVDISIGGFGLRQQDDNPNAIGQPRTVSFEWKGRQASFVCELRWLRAQHRLGNGAYGRSIYNAGYRVVHGTAEGYDIVRDILQEFSTPI